MRRLGPGGMRGGHKSGLGAVYKRFFDFPFLVTDPFQRHSRVIRGAVSAPAGHRAFDVPGTRLQTHSRCDAATFGVAARSPTDLVELCRPLEVCATAISVTARVRVCIASLGESNWRNFHEFATSRAHSFVRLPQPTRDQTTAVHEGTVQSLNLNYLFTLKYVFSLNY